MPFRSPKMKGFIFGFQRFVWCPKWTPASSKSFNAIPLKESSKKFPAPAAGNFRLPLTELEALARTLLSVLLPLLDARVARQEALFLEPRPELEVVFHQRARDPEPQRARLTPDA